MDVDRMNKIWATSGLQARSPTSLQDSMLRACLQDRSLQNGSAAPFLTLDDVRKHQYTILDDVWKHRYSTSASLAPGAQPKRVRRKQSKHNLTITTQLDSGFNSEDLSNLAALLPPSSPSFGSDMSRSSSITSPSLTSTATTMSVTPTQTPDSLDCNPFASSLPDEVIPLNEPIRTKRKFPIYKSAKRLPRWEAGGDGAMWTDGGNEVWEVHAVVVEPAIDFEALDDAEKERLLKRIVTPDVLIHQATRPDSVGRHGESFRQRENETPKRSFRETAESYVLESHRAQRRQHAGSEGEAAVGNSAGGEVDDPRSPFALFKFQFHHVTADYGETQEDDLSPRHSVSPMDFADLHQYSHHPSASSPPSPPSQSVSPAATLHYKGTSFDVVNPHASLLLGNHKFETPAEIDGIYNDYFDIDDSVSDDEDSDGDDDDNMAIDGTISAKVSQTSLRSHGDSPRTRVLYDDAEAARREILGAAPLKPRHDGNDERHSPLRFKHISHLQPRFSQKSEPFDLHVSDDGEDYNGHGNGRIDHIMQSAVEQFNHSQDRPIVGSTSPLVVKRAPSSYLEEETDTTMREIIDGYDHTRSIRRDSSAEPKSASEPILSSTKHGLEHTVLEKTHNRRSTQMESDKENVQPPKIAIDDSPTLPSPPAPVFNITNRRYGRHVEPTDLPTSEQTYGETNQLLLITPSDRQILQSAQRTSSQRSFVSSPAEHPFTYSDFDRPVSFLGALPTWNTPELPRGLRSYESSRTRHEYGGKSWTGYPTDTDSAWETQISDSEPDLTMLRRFSDDSYANTSMTGSNIQLPYQLPSFATLPYQGEDDEKENFDPKNLGSPAGSITPKSMQKPLLGDRDTQRAIGFLQSQLCATVDITPAAKEQRRIEARELEIIRLRNPLAVRKATEHVFNRYSASDLHSMSAKLQAGNPPKTPHRPRDSLRKIITMSPTSERKHLLHSPMGSPKPDSPGPNGALAFSDSANTFKTIRYGSPSPGPADMPVGSWSPMQEAVDWPLPPNDPRRSRASLPGFQSRLGVNASHATPAQRPSLRSAMNSQTELRQLRLSSLPKPAQPGGRALTADELIRQQSSWTDRPRVATPNGLERAAAMSPPIHDPVARTWRPRIGYLINNRNRALIRDAWDGHDEGAQAAQALSRRYMLLTAVCPFTALAFAWGHFDPLMAKKTQYRFVEMAPEHKREALVMFLPVGVVAWTFCFVLIGVLIWVATLHA